MEIRKLRRIRSNNMLTLLRDFENEVYDFIEMYHLEDEDPFVRKFETFFRPFLMHMFALFDDLERGSLTGE